MATNFHLRKLVYDVLNLIHLFLSARAGIEDTLLMKFLNSVPVLEKVIVQFISPAETGKILTGGEDFDDVANSFAEALTRAACRTRGEDVFVDVSYEFSHAPFQESAGHDDVISVDDSCKHTGICMSIFEVMRFSRMCKVVREDQVVLKRLLTEVAKIRVLIAFADDLECRIPAS